MRTSVRFALFVAASICFQSCGYATSADKAALTQLEQTWGNKYDFKLSSEIYWSARLRLGTNVDEEELRRIFDQFRGTRKDTALVYMNIYDSTGKFMFQLYRDRDGKITKETRAEHY